MNKKIYILPLFFLMLVSFTKADHTITAISSDAVNFAKTSDPLPSWNDGALKKRDYCLRNQSNQKRRSRLYSG